MSGKNWTPAPWNGKTIPICVPHRYGLNIANKMTSDPEAHAEGEANGRLMVLSPELYEALEGCLNELARHNIESGEARYAAHVLAKVRGEDSA